MIRAKSKVMGMEVELRLPENPRDLRKLAADDYSYTRLLQAGALQRQLTAARGAVLEGHDQSRVQAMLDRYKYKAHSLGGKVDQEVES